MQARHPSSRRPVPHRWLMTDERMGDALWTALERLPRGSGVIVRHYSLPLAERGALFAQIARIARRRGLVLVRAGKERLGRGEQGVHGRDGRRRPGLRSWPAHSAREVVAGRRAGADVILISPVFSTSSHPGARPLGPLRAARLARLAGGRAIAMGGVNANRMARLKPLGFNGWAAIDGWLPGRDQKRRTVPT